MRSFKALLFLTVLFLLPLNFSISEPLIQNGIKQESWMGIYSDDKRVGYSYNSRIKSGEFTVVKEFTNLKINLLGKDTEVYSEGTYITEGYKIISFEYEMRSDSINLKASGKRKADSLAITLDTVSGKTERSLPIKKELVLPSLVPKLLTKNKLAKGEKFDIPLFEPLSILMGMDDPVSTNTIEGEEVIEIALGEFDTYKVYSDFQGSRSTSWITKTGEVIKQEFPPGLIAKRESKKNILSKKNSSFNIINKTSIPTNFIIDDPRDLSYLKIKLEGINTKDFDIDDGYRQTVNGQIVEIRPNKSDMYESPYVLPYDLAEYSELTQADFLIQSDDKDIVAITNKVLNGEKDPAKASKKINNWIYNNLKKSPTVSLPNAKDVLKTRVGDCNEHAALFSAMSRAAGIPTKTVLGTMYYKDSFYYHAWNEVFLGQWVAVDSTYGQFPADATHIKLIEGNLAKSGEILKVVGKLNIEIIDAS